MSNREDDQEKKDKQGKQQQQQSGSGRPATKFMEKPKPGQKPDPQQNVPSEEEDIGEEGEGNLREDVDESQGGGDGGSQQSQQGQQQQKKGKQQKPGDN